MFQNMIILERIYEKITFTYKKHHNKTGMFLTLLIDCNTVLLHYLPYSTIKVWDYIRDSTCFDVKLIRII